MSREWLTKHLNCLLFRSFVQTTYTVLLGVLVLVGIGREQTLVAGNMVKRSSR